MREKLLTLLRPQVSPEVKLSVVALFLAKVLESFEPRIISLEERQLQKGDKGEKGDKGADGKNGKDGKDGLNGKNGLDGKDGKDGKAGAKGEKGVSVVDAEIAMDDHLVLKLSSGKEIDVGQISAKNEITGISVAGNAYQITVSASAPAHPQLNDLWLDVS